MPASAERTSTHSQVLPRIAAGDPAAMKEAVDQFGGLVWNIARRYLRNHSNTEDVVQEVFTEVWKKADRYNPSLASESTFVGLIARRRAIDSLRRQTRQPIFEPLDELPQLADGEGTAETQLSGDPDAALNALKQLPEETQNLFDLHFRLGLTHGEIVEKTGLPLGTVKTRLRRGLVALRNQLRSETQPMEPAP